MTLNYIKIPRLHEYKLAKQIWQIVNRSLSVQIQLEDNVFGTKLTSDLKDVVNCQNTRDNVVPRMQQWPLDIPQ